MNEKQNRLEEELGTICDDEYDGDKNKMILDLLIVMGYWAEVTRWTQKNTMTVINGCL